MARALAGDRAQGLGADEGELSETDPDLTERFRVLLDHAREFEKLFGVDRFPRMRKHLGWYCKGFPRPRRCAPPWFGHHRVSMSSA